MKQKWYRRFIKTTHRPDQLATYRLAKTSIDFLKEHILDHATIAKVEQLFDELLTQARAGRKGTITEIVAANKMQNVDSNPATTYLDEIMDHLTNLSQAAQLYMVLHDYPRMGNLRDRFMAEKVSKLVEQGEKVVVWAHNGHVSFGKPMHRERMGYHLQQTFGNRYYALALTFFKGSVRIFKSRVDCPEFSFAMPPAENIENLFRQSGIQKFFLDLRTLSMIEILVSGGRNRTMLSV